ncbi:MAG: hypothetical protein P8Y53_03415 [Pseudolabrys sp.]|jgi:hypothetical protein
MATMPTGVCPVPAAQRLAFVRESQGSHSGFHFTIACAGANRPRRAGVLQHAIVETKQ